MNNSNKKYYNISYTKHKIINIFQNTTIFVIFIFCTLLIIGMLYILFMTPRNKNTQELPQVDINTNFINISSHLAYEEETNIVYIRNIYHKAQDVYSIYYDALGKPMIYNGEEIPFDVKPIGDRLVVDINTKIIYRQDPSSKKKRKNYSAYYGSDGLLRYYDNGNLYPVNN